MNKIICSVLACACAAVMITGCSNPFSKKQEEDTTMSGYSYTADNNVKELAYKWIIKPSIDADNIITFDASQVDPESQKSTMCELYSVIKRGSKYGLIDYGGNIIIQPTYDKYYMCWCGEIVLYNVLDEKNGYYEYCTLDSSNQKVDYVADHEDNSPLYFWSDSDNCIYVKNKNDDYGTKYTGKRAVAVGEADINDVGGDNYEITPKEGSLYGLAKKDELLVDLQYQDFYSPPYMGTGKTLVAFKNDQGKWGYFGSDGSMVVDFKCDGDLNAYCGNIIDSEDKTHPYLFSADFAPVLVDSFYGYYNSDGECVVTPGEFEQARPVHNGRAWVRSNGLWGVIQLGEYIEPPVTTTTTTTTTSTTTTTTMETTSETTTLVTTVDTSVVSVTDPVPVDTDPVDTDPVDPVEPVDTDPIDPVDPGPVDPVDPVDPTIPDPNAQL